MRVLSPPPDRERPFVNMRYLIPGLVLAVFAGAGATLVMLGVVTVPGFNDGEPFPDMQVEMAKQPDAATPAELQRAAYDAFEEGKYLTAFRWPKTHRPKAIPRRSR